MCGDNTDSGSRSARLAGIFAIFLVSLSLPQPAAAVDLHRLWDDKCAECHGHSAEFARRMLSAADNRLLGRHHVDDLKLFLGNHYLMGQDIDGIYDMLLAQVNTPPRYAGECASCHVSAAELVRESIESRDGQLYVAGSSRTLDDFLEGHRGFSGEDAGFFSDLLARVFGEVHRR